MSAPNWGEELRDELVCPICLEPFKDPVILHCGHNYCQACITQCWGASGTGFCPQCRKSLPKGELRPNKPLEEAVDIARDLEGECKKHEEVFSLFCKEDRTLICMVCRESREHRDHTVVPIAAAAEEYKEQLLRHRNHFQCVREERRRWVAAKNGKYNTLVKKTEHLKQESVSEFKQVHQILKQAEQLLQNCLEGTKQDLVNTRNKNTNRCSRGLLPLNSLLAEINQKCQQPDIEFLKDIDSTLSRCEQVKSEEETPVDSLTELESRVQALSGSQKVLRYLLKKFIVDLAPELGPLANILSEVKRRVCCEDSTEEVPDDPEQDDTSVSLLDCEGEALFHDIPDSALDVLSFDLSSVIPHEESLKRISLKGAKKFPSESAIVSSVGNKRISLPDFEQPCTPKSLITQSQPPLKRAKSSTSAASLEYCYPPVAHGPLIRSPLVELPRPHRPPPGCLCHTPPQPAPCTSPHTSSPDPYTPIPPQP